MRIIGSARGPGSAVEAGADIAEQATEGDLSFLVQPTPETPIKGHRRVAQREEEVVAGGGQLDALDATVGRVADAADETLLLEVVQVVGEGGALDANQLGEGTLVVDLPRLQGEQDEPGRGGPTG